jgi:hypothetical protein
MPENYTGVANGNDEEGFGTVETRTR